MESFPGIYMISYDINHKIEKLIHVVNIDGEKIEVISEKNKQAVKELRAVCEQVDMYEEKIDNWKREFKKDLENEKMRLEDKIEFLQAENSFLKGKNEEKGKSENI